MKCVILAAGHGARLYPISNSLPKPLIDINGKTLLDWLIDDIDATGYIDEYIVVSNHKFVNHYREWAKTRNQKIMIFDDGTMSNENRCCALRDFYRVVDTLFLDEDVLLIAADSLLDFSLKGFMEYSLEKQETCMMRYYQKYLSELQRSNVVTLAKGDKILKMVEKPQRPETHWCTPAFYFFNRYAVYQVRIAVQEGCNLNEFGSFISWLCDREEVYAYEMPGKKYDINNLNDYKKVQAKFRPFVEI